MKGYEWREGMSAEESKNGVYWERNMLALLLADGWYYDDDNNWDGFRRVLSIADGSLTFHIPDDFEVGNLPEIKPNWDGHSTREKWELIASCLGIKVDWSDEVQCVVCGCLVERSKMKRDTAADNFLICNKCVERYRDNENGLVSL